MGKIKSIGMAQARPKLTQLVDEVNKSDSPYLIISGSQVKAVLMGITQYNDLLEQLEDISDAKEILLARLNNEPTMSWKDFLAKTKEPELNVSNTDK
jgi:prevent-host-death family protein